jgi:hypothetical protein
MNEPSSDFDRLNLVHLDGTRIFHTRADTETEDAIAEEIARHWNCTLNRFAPLCPIDWYAERNGRLVGLAELKNRTHASHTYPTVFLSVRKWLALSLGSMGLDCPALFIANFTNGVRWINVADIDARAIRICGASRNRAKMMADGSAIEPIIEVPIASLKILNAVAG